MNLDIEEQFTNQGGNAMTHISGRWHTPLTGAAAVAAARWSDMERRPRNMGSLDCRSERITRGGDGDTETSRLAATPHTAIFRYALSRVDFGERWPITPLEAGLESRWAPRLEYHRRSNAANDDRRNRSANRRRSIPTRRWRDSPGRRVASLPCSNTGLQAVHRRANWRAQVASGRRHNGQNGSMSRSSRGTSAEPLGGR